MKILKPILSVIVIAAIAGGVYYTVRQGSQQSADAARRNGADRPVAVVAKPAEVSDVPVYLEGVGSVKALNTATVRAQVDGRLISVNFKEGQDVKKGDVLAKIDPVTFQATLDQAKAKKALDEALLANQKRDLDRFQKVGTLAVSQQQIDTQKALVAQQEAQIKSDEAAIENASAILGYTTIVAPFDGRTGIRLVDEGNLVHAGDSGGIVVITQVQPISALFVLPQQQLPTLTKAMAGGALSVQAFSTDNQIALDTGKLEVIDNQVDPTTGTIKLKADFPNAQRQLWPGQFINVRLLVDTLKGVVTVPTESVQRGPNGPYVYVVDSDNTVAMRSVKISRQDEKHAVIADGVSAGETVVTSGFGRLKDGSSVSVGGSEQKPGSPADKVHDGKDKRDGKSASIEGANPPPEDAKASAGLTTGSNKSEAGAVAPEDRANRHRRKQENGGARP